MEGSGLSTDRLFLLSVFTLVPIHIFGWKENVSLLLGLDWIGIQVVSKVLPPSVLQIWWLGKGGGVMMELAGSLFTLKFTYFH